MLGSYLKILYKRLSTNSDLSTDIKDILTTIKNNLSTYPQKTYDILDDVINGNQRVKVQTNW